jgi:polyhydroxybutyrate depolymerase
MVGITDGAADGGGEIVTELDGGLVFINGVPDPDAGICSGGVVGGDRPVQVRVPTGYTCTESWPLVVLLHDYGSSGAAAESYFQVAANADALGFLYVHPDGTTDAQGNEFWNATNACCNVDGSTVDDSSYLASLVNEIHVKYNADQARVYVYGNGGFMAYRFACDNSLMVTALADFGGATWASASQCPARSPLGALEIHGTDDQTFAYDGGTNLGAAYPSAPGTIAEWAALERCADAGVAGAGLELLDDDAGTDTTVLQWSCTLHNQVALWTIQGGTHQPSLASSFTPTVLGALLAQTKH